MLQQKDENDTIQLILATSNSSDVKVKLMAPHFVFLEERCDLYLPFIFWFYRLKLTHTNAEQSQ